MTARRRRSRLTDALPAGVACRSAVCASGAWSQRLAQRRSWPTERPPRPLAARDVKFPPYQIQTLPERPAGRGGAAPRAAGGQHAAAGAQRDARSDPKDKLGLAQLAASLLDQGTTTKSAEQINDAIDFIGGAHGRRRRHRPDLREHGRDEGQLRRRAAHAVRHGAAAGVRAGRDRAAAAADAVGAAGQPARIPEYVADAVFDRLVYGFHPYGMPGNGTPQTHRRRSRATIWSRFTGATSCRTTPSSPSSAMSPPRKRSPASRRCSATGPGATCRPQTVHRAAGADAARDRRQQAGRGADRNPRRPSRHPAQASRLHGAQPRHPHSRRRGQQPPAPGAADRARRSPTARRPTWTRSRRRGDFEAETNTRTDATGEVLRLIVDEFWRLQRERVGERELAGREGVSDRQLPADHRDAGRRSRCRC